MPIALSRKVARQSIENLNQLLADTFTLRDLYKKCQMNTFATRATRMVRALPLLSCV